MWEKHLAGEYALGCFPLTDDATCRWGGIDVDVYDLDLNTLEVKVNKLNLPLVVCRTKSGGAHLYLFMKSFVPAKLLRDKLMEWAIALGYSGVEVFPKQTSLSSEKSFGNWLNMPYFNGDETTRHAIKKGTSLTVEEFILYAVQKAIDKTKLESIKVKVPAELEGAPPCLKSLAQSGIPAGQRNDALYNYGVYLRKRYGPDELEDKLAAMNQKFMVPPVGHREVTTVAKSVKKKDYFYTCSRAPIQSVCNRQICLTCEFGVGDGTAGGINITNRHLPDLAADAWEALVDRNADAPTLFQFGDRIARVDDGIRGMPKTTTFTEDDVRHELTRASPFYRVSAKGRPGATDPPVNLIKDLLVTPRQHNPLPPLEGITTAPVMSARGEVRTAEGYDPETRLFFAPPEGLVIGDVPSEPNEEEIADAIARLSEPFSDFPFEGEADKAHALGLLILPFARPMIDGPTPLHLIEKPKAGTGATLLVDVISTIFQGRAAAVMTEAQTEDEWRKRITAKLREAPQLVLLDNLNDTLKSSALAAAITGEIWTDRILGVSRVVELPVRCAWVATGNNPTLSEEIARRSVRIRLDAKTETPWEGRHFRHPKLLAWVKENRGPLIAAALTVLRAWVVAGRPPAEKTLGRFEAWAEVIGGALQNAGVEGFLGNVTKLYETADTEGQAWRTLIAAWWNEHNVNPTTAKQLFNLVIEHGIPISGVRGTTHGDKTRLGKGVQKLIDQRFTFQLKDGRRLELSPRRAGLRDRVAVWELVRYGGAEGSGETKISDGSGGNRAGKNNTPSGGGTGLLEFPPDIDVPEDLREEMESDKWAS